MKIKVFEHYYYDDNNIEMYINKWLTDKDIVIHQMSCSESKSSNGNLHKTLYILYEEKKENNVSL